MPEIALIFFATTFKAQGDIAEISLPGYGDLLVGFARDERGARSVMLHCAASAWRLAAVGRKITSASVGYPCAIDGGRQPNLARGEIGGAGGAIKSKMIYPTTIQTRAKESGSVG